MTEFFVKLALTNLSLPYISLHC